MTSAKSKTINRLSRYRALTAPRAAAIAIIAVVAPCSVCAGNAEAAPLIAGPRQQIVLSDAAALERFGSSVAIDGDTAAVGAPNDDTPLGVNAGAVYVFVRNAQGQWQQRQRLTGSNAVTDNHFGETVALSGRGLLVGAPDRNTAAGAVYVFRRSTDDTSGSWSEEALLAPPALVAADVFGSALSISGNTAVIGALGDTTNSGAAYVFVRGSGTPPWTQQGGKLLPPQRVTDAAFGFAVAVDGDLALVGAPGQTETGSVFAFRRTGTAWGAGQSVAVAAPLAALANGDAFGSAISISGSWALIGAPRADVAGVLEAGSAFFFEHSAGSWVGRQRFNSPEPVDTGGFGSSVALAGTRAAAGATLENDEAGQVHLFSREASTWAASGMRVQGNADEGGFGAAVAIGTNALLVGAPQTPCVAGSECGAAHAFALSDAAAAVPGLGAPAALVLGALSLATAGLAARRRRRASWEDGCGGPQKNITHARGRLPLEQRFTVQR